MKTHCQFLSENEQLKIHENSIKILEEVGVKFLSDKALKVLENNGATVDYAEKLAKIPREMVDQALKTAPKSFVLGARNPEFDVSYPSAHTGYVLDCGGVFTFDYKKGERRYSTLQACRSAEFLMPILSDRNTFENWVNLGRPDLYDKAQKKVEEILAAPQKHPLSDDVIGKLEAIIRRAEEELK